MAREYKAEQNAAPPGRAATGAGSPAALRKRRPRSPDALEARGDSLLQERQVAKAVAAYQEALDAGADPSFRAYQRWLCWMYLGKLERAWEESDRIGRSREHNDPENNHVIWDGRPIEGKTVLVRCLHGLGDTVQFIRYVPLLKAVCPRVIVKAQPHLLRLLQGVPGIDLLLSGWTTDPDPPFEAEVEVMELPYIFRTTLDTIPAAIPYLHVEEQRVEKAAALLKETKGLRVGLVWATSAWDRTRCVPLDSLAPLFGVPGVSFVSLQLGEDAKELRARGDLPVLDLETSLEDVADTAAVIRNLDLVISVDTMVTHLAGALGCPTWVLLQHAADWRWMVDCTDSPWYPTARLWRQPAPGDWESPILEMARELEQVARNPKNYE